MPSQTGKSPLLAKYGQRFAKAADAHKADPIEMGNARLPGGIEGGVAQLVDCHFVQIAPGKQNAGHYMFYGAGVVKEPAEHRGARTQISEMLFDTPNRTRKTQEEHVAWVQNQAKLLLFGAATDFDPEPFSAENLEETCAQLEREQPHFKFRTSELPARLVENRGGKWFVTQKGKVLKGPFVSEAALKAADPYAGGPPTVYEEWLGRRDYADPEANGEVVDAGDTAVPAEEDAPEVPVEEATVDEGPDLDALAAAADGPKGKAQHAAAAELTVIAEQVGISNDDFLAADTYASAVELIRAAQSGEKTAEPEPEPEAEAVERGQVRTWQPVDAKGAPLRDPKTKKAVKPIKVEVMTSDDKSEVATIKNLTTDKLVLGADKKPLKVAWADLTPSS